MNFDPVWCVPRGGGSARSVCFRDLRCPTCRPSTSTSTPAWPVDHYYTQKNHVHCISTAYPSHQHIMGQYTSGLWHVIKMHDWMLFIQSSPAHRQRAHYAWMRVLYRCVSSHMSTPVFFKKAHMALVENMPRKQKYHHIRSRDGDQYNEITDTQLYSSIRVYNSPAQIY